MEEGTGRIIRYQFQAPDNQRFVGFSMGDADVRPNSSPVIHSGVRSTSTPTSFNYSPIGSPSVNGIPRTPGHLIGDYFVEFFCLLDYFPAFHVNYFPVTVFSGPQSRSTSSDRSMENIVLPVHQVPIGGGDVPGVIPEDIDPNADGIDVAARPPTTTPERVAAINVPDNNDSNYIPDVNSDRNVQLISDNINSDRNNSSDSSNSDSNPDPPQDLNITSSSSPRQGVVPQSNSLPNTSKHSHVVGNDNEEIIEPNVDNRRISPVIERRNSPMQDADLISQPERQNIHVYHSSSSRKKTKCSKEGKSHRSVPYAQAGPSGIHLSNSSKSRKISKSSQIGGESSKKLHKHPEPSSVRKLLASKSKRSADRERPSTSSGFRPESRNNICLSWTFPNNARGLE